MLYGCLVPHPPLIVPEVGGADEVPAMRAAYEKIAAEIEEISADVLVVVSPHIFPRYKLKDTPPTPVDTIYHLTNIARQRLRYVYEGNV
jgi:pyruvate formate lyase activating enzyme